MDEIVIEYDTQNTFYEARIYAHLINIVVCICRVIMQQPADKREREPGGQITKQKEYLEVIMNVCNYINQHYQENPHVGGNCRNQWILKVSFYTCL